MNDLNENPKVGVGVMIFKNKKILLGKRLGSHGAGEYAFPGGHLEYGESFEICGRRETLEETGLILKNIYFLMVANVTKYIPYHYVHINLIADWKNGQPQNREPEACAGWDWYDLNYLPHPLFEMTRLSINSYQTGRNYYDNY